MKKQNFSLIEVLVAITIIAICFTVLMVAMSLNIKNTAISQGYLIACLLAKEKMADIVYKGDKIKEGEKKGDFGEDYPGFNWKTNIKKQSKYLYSVKTNISFIKGGDERNLKLTSLVLNQKALKKTKDKKTSDKSQQPFSPQQPK